jgi:hypothetical protein
MTMRAISFGRRLARLEAHYRPVPERPKEELRRAFVISCLSLDELERLAALFDRVESVEGEDPISEAEADLAAALEKLQTDYSRLSADELARLDELIAHKNDPSWRSLSPDKQAEAKALLEKAAVATDRWAVRSAASNPFPQTSVPS